MEESSAALSQKDRDIPSLMKEQLLKVTLKQITYLRGDNTRERPYFSFFCCFFTFILKRGSASVSIPHYGVEVFDSRLFNASFL